MRYRKKSLVTCALTLLLLSCGGGGSGDNSDPQVTPAPTPTPTTTPTPTPTPEPTGDYVNGQVLLIWDAPVARENGEPILPEDLGGYEVRFKRYDQAEYTYQMTEAEENHYLFEYLEGYYEFQVAVYDTNGLYSRFIPLTPQ